MKCPKCQFDNREGAKFCSECGLKFELSCPECDASIRARSKFCDECGCALEPPLKTFDDGSDIESLPLQPAVGMVAENVAPVVGERKHVTVLFSDLTGYTALSERLDPEEVKDITTQIFDKISKIVSKYEGFIEKYAGDAVMVLFGATKSHEDDPVRAIRAAREIHNMVDSLSPKYEESIQQTLSMHTGINTGLVVTGEINMAKGLHGVAGDTVNVASRLSYLAKEGEILVSPDTHRQAEKYFIFKRLDSTRFKGKTKFIVPYSVVGETKIQTRFEAAQQRGLTFYTGREQELSTLQVCLGKVIAGQGQFITVVGEAGIGKSRLLFEFRHSLDRNKVIVLEGRCQSYGVDTPYLPMINALKRGLDLREDDSPAKLLEKAVANIQDIDPALKAYIPYYLHLLSIPSDKYFLPKDQKGEELKRALQESLAAIITLNTQHNPMVLILEDWHWVDEASDSALKHLVSMTPSYPLMIVVLYRPEYQASWGSMEIHTPLVLKPLGRQNTEEIIKSTFNASRLPEDIGEMIHERTGGNPLFIEEVASSLIDQGAVLVKNHQAFLTQSVNKIHLPDTVQAVISSRFDRLDEKMQETLRFASVIGREFAQRILERITPNPKELSRPLEELKAMEVIQQIKVLPEAEYIFKHVLTQVVVYESLLLKRRRELHGLVGQAIEEFYVDRLEEQYEALAHHYSNSDNLQKAIQFLERAGDKATRYFSLGEARTHYRAAIEFLASLKKSSDTKRSYINLSLKWAEVSHYVATEEHIKILKSALKYGQDLKDEALVAKITYWIGRMQYSLGNMVESLPYLDRCIEMAGELEGEEMLALPYNVIGRTRLFTSEWVKGADYLEKGIPMLERLGNPEEVAYSMGMLGLFYGFMGSFERGFSLNSKALNISREIDNKTREAATLMYRSVLYHYQGAWKESLKYGFQSIDICKEIQNPVIEGLTTWIMGYSTFHEGDRQKGIDLLRAGIEKIEATGSSFTLGLGYGWRAEAHALADQEEEAQLCAEKSIDLGKIGERWGEVYVYRALAVVAAKKRPPDWDKVDINMKESLRLAEERCSKPEKATGCFRYAELLRGKGDLDRAMDYLIQAKELFSKMNMIWWIEQTEKLEEELL
jgi:class 3 adenylate cyclase/tetratricopeptide (TPR) repeat protein